jgi:hypothetical protein
MSDLERIRNFIATFERLPRRARENVFALLKIGKDEVRHSGVLAWLLDPRGSHGQGVSFLRAFTEVCRLEVESEALQRCQSRTEVSGQEAVIDVAVYSPGELLIYIEHKIDSPEGPRQIDREFADMRRHGAALGVCGTRQTAVFLSPQGRPPTSGCACRWRTLSHGRLVEAFRPAQQRMGTSESSVIVRDWLDELRAWEGVTEMPDLPDESLFIARNWETVEDVLAATGQLRNAFAGLLRSLQPALESLDWWRDGWEFRTLGSEQAYISHRDWRVGDQPAVWIGVERFGPEGVLGHQAMAQLYVWVLAKHSALAQELGAALAAGAQPRPGEVGTRGSGGYVVRHAVETCLPEEIDGYAQRATAQILEFMDHYAKAMRQFDGLIRQHIGPA